MARIVIMTAPRPRSHRPSSDVRCSVGALATLASLLLALGWAPDTRAQGLALPDPTRPPAAFITPPSDTSEAAVEVPVLQSVIIADGRRGAIISGEYVPLGGRYRDGRLAQVGDAWVVLRGTDGVQTLRLYPAVQRRTESPREPAPGGAGKSGSNSTRIESKVAR